MMKAKERVWFKCQFCNGTGKIVYWYDTDNAEEIDCLECDGAKGWWITTEWEQ